jgi:hypothetical protein
MVFDKLRMNYCFVMISYNRSKKLLGSTSIFTQARSSSSLRFKARDRLDPVVLSSRFFKSWVGALARDGIEPRLEVNKGKARTSFFAGSKGLKLFSNIFNL